MFCRTVMPSSPSFQNVRKNYVELSQKKRGLDEAA